MIINITVGGISKTIKVEDDPKLREQIEMGNDIYVCMYGVECNLNLSISCRGNEVIDFRIHNTK